MQKTKRIIIGFLLLWMLTGCRARQLEDRDFVQAMELEWDGEELYGGFGKFTADGDSVKEVIRDYQEEVDKYLDLGHVKVLILGEQLMGNEKKLKQVLHELEEMPILARNILVLSYDYQGEESCLKKLEEKGIAPGDYISNLYKNNPDRSETLTLGELISEVFSE